MEVFNFLNKHLANNIVDHHIERMKPAQYAGFPEDLAPAIRDYLTQKGIKSLYKHQKESYELVRTGKNLVISTGVASGKSLCYQLPILQTIQENKEATALLLFPTKALTQDQKKGFIQFLSDPAYKGVKVGVGIYDGDTIQKSKREIREKAKLVFTNPDMLHLGILPHHANWANFFKNLKYIVIDEVHIYRGVFGSHFANVLRRLNRITIFYGVKPIYILTSATLANTRDFITNLIESEFEIIDRDYSPHAQRHFIIYNPPLLDQELGLRKNYLMETVRIAGKITQLSGQQLIFAHTRRMVEFILTYLKKRSGSTFQIHGYRGGYLPEERRRIESEIREGKIKITIATNALELGVDIGGLDFVIINGYPGSIASVRQQAGRAGRRGKTAYTVLVLSSELIDQYLAQHPGYIYENDPEAALINPDNPFILLHHLKCALFEKPFSNLENFGRITPSELAPYLDLLQEYGFLMKEDKKSYWFSESYPASEISLRTIGSGGFVLQNKGKTIGLVDHNSAFWMTHPHAIYLHDGESYFVEKLDLAKKLVQLTKVRSDYYTQSISQNQFELLKLKRNKQIRGGEKYYGQLKVVHQVTGFKKIRWGSQELMGYEDLDLPAHDMITFGYWFGIARDLVNQLKLSSEWNNETNDYGKDWQKITRQIKTRDKFKCVICGASSEQIGLHVHHKKPFRSFVDKKQANSRENLITLCSACHKKTEKRIYIQSGLSGLTNLLGNIAPFFLMCDRHDIKVHQEKTSKLTEGSPTLVFYDAVPGGIGLAEKLYEIHDKMIEEAYITIMNCSCNSGCPACVGPISERGKGAKNIVKSILKGMISA